MGRKTNAWCPVCTMPARLTNNRQRDCYTLNCPRCGEYAVGEAPKSSLDFSDHVIANASGYIRANKNFYLGGSDDIEFLLSLKTPTVGQRAERLLRALANQYPTPGTSIKIPFGIDNSIKKYRTSAFSQEPTDGEVMLGVAKSKLFMLSYGWAIGEDDLTYLLFDYHVESSGYLTGERHRIVTGGVEAAQVTISPAGWEFIQSSPPQDGNVGFVAMWFSADMLDAYEKALYPAIQAAGYVPLRIDKKEHNNRIDDEIIAAIRGCRFLVADFTGSRGGVYYEAGFAGGLGIPVIWTVRDDHLDDVHFDTRQYNHIVWKKNALSEFREALANRIVATIGKGPNV